MKPRSYRVQRRNATQDNVITVITLVITGHLVISHVICKFDDVRDERCSTGSSVVRHVAAYCGTLQRIRCKCNVIFLSLALTSQKVISISADSQ